MRTRVIVLLKPRVWTAVGKKFLNPLAAKCMCCMKANSHSLGSRAASFRPARLDVPALLPTVSRSMRSCASCRSSGVSHLVLSGWSGRVKTAPIATMNVAMPCWERVRAGSRSEGRGVTHLDNEQPSPSCQAANTVHLEQTKGDKPCKGCGENVAGVKNGDSSGDLFTGVKDREHEQSSGIVRCLERGKLLFSLRRKGAHSPL